MEDAQWLPLDVKKRNESTKTQEKVYSEVTSGSWYKRTYDRMIVKQEETILDIQHYLLQLYLDKMGHCVTNLSVYQLNLSLYLLQTYPIKKEKNIMRGFVLGL